MDPSMLLTFSPSISTLVWKGLGILGRQVASADFVGAICFLRKAFKSIPFDTTIVRSIQLRFDNLECSIRLFRPEYR